MSPNAASAQRPPPPAPHLEEGSESWAISYADFLMVLLCFFIFFFSMETPAPKAETAPLAAYPTLPEGLKESLRKIGDLDVRIVGERAEISFPEDLYPLGGYELNENVTRELDTVIRAIRENMRRYKIEVVGHADATDIRHRGVVLTNFDLSVLRSSRALQYLVQSGFDEKTLSARGESSHVLSRRTLSLVIEPISI